MEDGKRVAESACCSGVATALLRCCEPVGPLYIPCTSLVHPLYSRGDFGSPPVSPPRPRFDLTAFVWPLFKRMRTFSSSPNPAARQVRASAAVGAKSITGGCRGEEC